MEHIWGGGFHCYHQLTKTLLTKCKLAQASFTHQIRAALHLVSLDKQTRRKLQYHGNSPRNDSQNKVKPIHKPSLSCVRPVTSKKPGQT